MKASIYTITTMLFMFLITGATIAPPDEYSDLPLGWSREAMINTIEKGLFYGSNGKIMPKSDLTRAQLIAVINRCVNTSGTADISDCTDVKQSDWFYGDMAIAVYEQYLPFTDNKLYPNNYTTREEVFSALAKALVIEPLSDDSSLKQFDDYDQISSWAKGNVAAMVERGYMLSSNNKLEPTLPVTREEFAYVINQIFNLE